MEDNEQKVNNAESRSEMAAHNKHEKTPDEKRTERIQWIDNDLRSFNDGNLESIDEIEARRNQEFETKKQSMEKAGIPISAESKNLIHKNMVEDHIDYAVKENERFDKLKIEKIVLENVDNPDSILIKRLFPYDQNIPEEVFFDSLEKLCKSSMNTSVSERVNFFRRALEYFSEKRKTELPIGHATGSGALKSIIESGAIKEGGTGEYGEGSSQSRYEPQEGISVAIMKNGIADYVELFYARMAANKDITKSDLSIDADTIYEDNTIVNDMVNGSLRSMSKEEILSSIAEKLQISLMEVTLEISKESNKEQEDITKDDIKKSSLLKQSLSKIFDRGRKHFLTEETLGRDYNAFTSIIDQCERGEFPKVIYENKEIERPEDIISLNLPLHEPIDENEKILLEIHQKYNEWLSEKNRSEQSASYSLDVLYKNKSRILKEYADFIKIKRDKLKKLLGNKERLADLSRQFPCIMIAEGKNYPTFSAQYGRRPVHYFEAEERILTDIPLENIEEIIVPQKRIPEVKKWFADSGIKNEDMPKMVAFEYFEIKRIINHQLEEKPISPELLTDREKLSGEKTLTEIAKKYFPQNEFEERAETTLENFRNGSLLAHTANLEQIDSLFDTFNRDKEIKNLSTSLIVENGKNTFYGSRGIGLLFDGGNVVLEHISKEDSSSSGQGNEFHASDHAKAESLVDLSNYLRSPEANSINEVNINFNLPKGVLGIFGKNSVAGKLDAAVAYIKMGRRLPLFIFKDESANKNTGSIEKWEPTQEELVELINQYPVAGGRKRYKNILGNYK